ncbi:hypothetical protein BS47DRAFT_1361511 [Hydnum rufescens UP504]|uniref:Uncharacterized protein n=1 Tax=Hydnum rufescens UP504 TaxID=1448309 RepID=A0A9P6B0L5_9AGAM|nr:hypothetical protein BS47DRAFT_1361511 [Hydnum rufescens UP504]
MRGHMTTSPTVATGSSFVGVHTEIGLPKVTNCSDNKQSRSQECKRAIKGHQKIYSTPFNFKDIANSSKPKIKPEVLQGPVENLFKQGYTLIIGNMLVMGLCSEGKRIVYVVLPHFLGSESTRCNSEVISAFADKHKPSTKKSSADNATRVNPAPSYMQKPGNEPQGCLMTSMMASVDCCIFPGHSFAWNWTTGSHYDTCGPLFDWTPLVAVQAPHGAHLILHSLKEILFFETGAVIFLRGGEWQHQPGERVTITHFSHKSVWRAMGKVYDWESNSYCGLKEGLRAEIEKMKLLS